MAKIVFLPHCLRAPDCRAKLSSEGYICLDCGKCRISSFLKKAKEKGYDVFIVPGASLIKKILEDYGDPEIVIGVACDAELKEGLAMMKKYKIKAKALKLLKDGCINTEVDFDKLESML